MANDSTLNTPVIWINKYLQHKIADLTATRGSKPTRGINETENSYQERLFNWSNSNADGFGIPIFPSSPSTIDDLTETFIKIDGENYSYTGIAAYWDRLAKMNKTGFPHIKCEQILYYFYSTQDNVTEKLVRTQEAVLRLMDRGDETAEEINDWCKNRQVDLGGELVDNMFYFHNFKVYQLEETRDIIDFGTARTYGGNKFIIDYDYHQMPELTNNSWRPEVRPPGTAKYPI